MTGALLVICSFFIIKQTFDIRIFDTFYVIRLKYLYWLLAGMLALYWLFYRFNLMRLFSVTLTNIHIIVTMLVCILILIFHISSGQLYFKNTSLNFYDVPRFQKNNFYLTLLLLVLMAVQCIFAVNFLWSMIVNNKPAGK